MFKKIGILAGLAFLTLAPTTSTNVGRIPLAHPDLGHDGGAALHTKMNTIYTDLSNHLNSRYFEFSLANGAFSDFTHNFQTPFADIGYELYWRAGTGELTRITDTTSNSDCGVGAPVITEFTIAGGPDTTDQVRVTNSTGETCLLALLITQNKGISRLKDLTDVDTTGATNNQPLVYNSGTTKWEDKSFSSALNTASTGAGLNDLNDTVLTGPSTNQSLNYNGTNWVNTALGTAADTASTGISLDNVNNVTAPSPQDGQALVYNNSLTRWEPGASGDASFKLQSVSHPNGVIKGGTIELRDGRQLKTYNGGGPAEANFGVDLTCALTSYVPTPTNAAIYYLYINLGLALDTPIIISETKQKVYPITCSDLGLTSGGTTGAGPEELIGNIDHLNSKYYFAYVRTADSGNSYSGTNSRFSDLARRQAILPEYEYPAAGKSHNFLRNANFGLERSNDNDQSVVGWTATPTTIISTTKTVGEVISGFVTLEINSTATSQTVVTATSENSSPAYLGKACLVRFQYEYPSPGVAGDYTVTVQDGSTSLFTPVSLTQTDGTRTNTFEAGFMCPAAPSGSLSILISSTNNGSVLTVDDTYLGLDDRRGVLGDSAELIASAHYPGAASCSWLRTNTALGQVTPDDTDCPSIVADIGTITPTITTGDFPKITIPNLPPGKYQVSASFSLGNSASAQPSTAALSDVANCASGFEGILAFQTGATSGAAETAATVIATFEYTTTATRTFEICTAANPGNVTIENGSTNRSVQFVITRFPTQSPRDVVTLETSGWYVDANIGGTNPTLGTTSIANYSVIPGATLDLVKNAGSADVGIACAGAQSTVGSLTCSGNESVGVTLNIPYAGTARICFAFGHQFGSTDDPSDIASTFQVVRTPNNADTFTAVTDEGKERVQHRVRHDTTGAVGASIYNDAFHVCGTFVESSGQKTYKLFYEQDLGVGNFDQSVLLTDRAGSGGQRDVHIYAHMITQQFPQAIALNNIETGAGAGGCTKGNLCSGTYTPDDNEGTGVFTSAVAESAYTFMRVGNQVTVAGRINITTSAGGAYTFDIPLPIASNFTLGSDAAGVGITGAAGSQNDHLCAILPETTDDEVLFQCRAGAALTGNAHLFNFNYQVK